MLPSFPCRSRIRYGKLLKSSQADSFFGSCMNRACVTLVIEADRKSSRFRIAALFPLAVVPARPGMFVGLIAVVEIGEKLVSPPTPLGMVVDTAPDPPVAYPRERAVR